MAKKKKEKKGPAKKKSASSSKAKAKTREVSPFEESSRLASRFENFARLAEARAHGDMVTLPRMLRDEQRRLHVRQTLREDHRERIDASKEDTSAKFDKLAGSKYSFFRGTSLLFYRDMAGEDAWMPTVLTLGDVHPENFGVMPNADNAPVFAVNDFDEAYYAPFTWDLKRGALGFLVAAKENGLKKKKREKIVRKFLKGYLAGIEEFAEDESEIEYQQRIDNSPPIIRDLLIGAQKDREGWLSKYLGEKRKGFVAGEDIVPLSSRVEELQKIVDDYVKDNDISPPKRAGEMKVKDVAQKRGSGTASLGLPRYFILLEGPTEDGTDDLIIEMKRARRSSLDGLAPPSQYTESGEAERVVNAQAVHLVGGDPFYGKAVIGGASFLVRERSPYKDEIDLDDLSYSEWKTYAKVCGRTLSQAHALADEHGSVDKGVEERILEAVAGFGRKLFMDDVLRFAKDAHARLERDHACFVQDHALGAFRHVDRVYK